jgi:signal transduction histidine kinase
MVRGGRQAVAYFTTSIAVVAGLCLAFGVIYVFTGVRRPSHRTLNLLFGFFALAYGGAIMTARAAFMADTVDQFASAVRISTVISAVGFALLVWFVAAYTDVQPRVLLWTVTGAFAIVGGAGIIAPDLILSVAGGVSRITLPWGESVLMVREETAPLEIFFIAALLVSIIYIVVADIKQFRRGERSEAVVLAVGIGWFILTIVEENLVSLGVLDFVFLSDFGFLGFVLAMGLEMVNRAIDTETELIDYQENLESKVEVRSVELQKAQALLLTQAEEEATAAERNRLARELHDVITQLLFSINLVAGSLPLLWQMDPEMAERSTGELQRLTRGALSEMRTLLRELRPHTIEETDLETLVTHLTEGLAAREDIPAEIDTEMTGSLPTDVHIAIYRIAQEAMNNVAKHANASGLVVNLTGADSRVDLVISDDGYGFDDSDASVGGMGIGIMRERASEIGAELTVSSRQDVGTRVEVVWTTHPASEIE